MIEVDLMEIYQFSDCVNTRNTNTICSDPSFALPGKTEEHEKVSYSPIKVASYIDQKDLSVPNENMRFTILFKLVAKRYFYKQFKKFYTLLKHN